MLLIFNFHHRAFDIAEMHSNCSDNLMSTYHAIYEGELQDSMAHAKPILFLLMSIQNLHSFVIILISKFSKKTMTV